MLERISPQRDSLVVKMLGDSFPSLSHISAHLRAEARLPLFWTPFSRMFGKQMWKMETESPSRRAGLLSSTVKIVSFFMAKVKQTCYPWEKIQAPQVQGCCPVAHGVCRCHLLPLQLPWGDRGLGNQCHCCCSPHYPCCEQRSPLPLTRESRVFYQHPPNLLV